MPHTRETHSSRTRHGPLARRRSPVSARLYFSAMTSHDALFSAAARGMRFSAIRRMSALIERPGIISFAPGQPSPETFPVEAFRQITEEILARDSAQAFQYVLTRGVGALVEAVREYARAKGIAASTAETIVTDGSQQGLDLVSRVLVDPGDVVPWRRRPTSARPRPSGPPRRGWWAYASTRAASTSTTSADATPRSGRRAGAVKFLYVIPNFQNPSGISHSAESRRELMDAARELDLLVVEDDPYGDLDFEEAARPTLKSMDEDGRVVYLSSFSRILAPGLRTAFADRTRGHPGQDRDREAVREPLREQPRPADRARLPGARAHRGAEGAHPAVLPREARPHGGRARGAGSWAGVTWVKPAGGMFVRLALPEGMDAEKLLPSRGGGRCRLRGGCRPFFVDGSVLEHRAPELLQGRRGTAARGCSTAGPCDPGRGRTGGVLAARG